MKDLSANPELVKRRELVLSGLGKLIFAKGDSQIGSGTSLNWEDLFLWEQESTVTECGALSILASRTLVQE